jgi:hypothetical protein
MDENTNATNIAHEEDQVALQNYLLNSTRMQLQHSQCRDSNSEVSLIPKYGGLI